MQGAFQRHGCLYKSMINHHQKLIYIHPPKTGGWSITDLWGAASPIPDEEGRYEFSPVHHSMKFYRNFHFDLNHYFIFATTRNPWDRIVSAYFWLKQHGGGRLPKNIEGKDCNFEEYIEWLILSRINVSHDRNNVFWSHPNSILDWVTINNQVSVDYFCNIHTFEEDFEFVLETLGSNKKLPHTNKSSHDDYRKYYTDKLVEKVEFFFKKDIEYFKYKFDDKNYSDFNRIVNPEKIEKYKRLRQLLITGFTKL